ncbi:uncharacterized protein LOC128209294 isoform X2 [Mya arenaria]|uniref:uncharacterized protein LOC128209294 isoform X2 n=1 Tax=Mya arenaria TaxID=6604 RepID=UPI0022E3F834|nr:uncharacterized protein LOC128209294 isoform X2 [Mya arenaria]
MRVLVSNATSPLAYQLLPLLASGEVFSHEAVNLVLCGCEERRIELEGVRMELLDCVFPSLTSVTITSDFCESCKSSDVILVLPEDDFFCRHGDIALDVCFSFLPNLDFKDLDGVLHPNMSEKEVDTYDVHGPLSAATAIARFLCDAHQSSLATHSQVNLIQSRSSVVGIDLREEAEYGCPPDRQVESCIAATCDHHFNSCGSQGPRVLLAIPRRVGQADTRTTDTDDPIYANASLYSRL